MQRLVKGLHAPNIVTESISGDPINLKEMAGQKLWLAFYRYAHCPLCIDHMDHVLTKAQDLMRQNIRVLCFFESKIENFPKKFLKLHNPWLYLISDPEQKAYEAFQVENNLLKLLHPETLAMRAKAGMKGYIEKKMDGNMGRVPAHFLIWKDLRVFKAHYGRSMGDHISWRDIDKFGLINEKDFLRSSSSDGEIEIEIDEQELDDAHKIPESRRWGS